MPCAIFQAGLYFNKIQCFCFEEQRLNPHEDVCGARCSDSRPDSVASEAHPVLSHESQVDMPVFFYIDPEFAEDPNLMDVRIYVAGGAAAALGVN